MVSLGIFPKLPTEPCALGLTQPLKMSTRKTTGGKDGRCVRVTTLPSSQSRKSRKSGVLTYRIPKGRLRPVAGELYLYLSIWSSVAYNCWIICESELEGSQNTIRFSTLVTDLFLHARPYLLQISTTFKVSGVIQKCCNTTVFVTYVQCFCFLVTHFSQAKACNSQMRNWGIRWNKRTQ